MDWIVPESFLLRMKSNSVGISQCLKNNQDRFKAGVLTLIGDLLQMSYVISKKNRFLACTFSNYKYKKIGIPSLDLCPACLADLCPIPGPAGSSSSAHIGTHVPT